MVLDPDFCLRLTAALGHFLWQGTAVALLVALARPLLNKHSSQARYAVLCGALALMAACPVVTFALLGRVAPDATVAALPPAALTTTPARFAPDAVAAPPDHRLTEADARQDPVDPAAADDAIAAERPLDHRAPIDVATVAPVAPPSRAGVTALTPLAARPPPSSAIHSLAWERLAPYATAAYLVGVAFMVARLLLALYGGQRLSRSCQPVDDPALLTAIARQVKAIGLPFTPAVALCARVTVPAVVGAFRPMLLLPVSLATGLSIAQIEVLVAHELAHIRRYDHVVNLVQRVLEAFLFFHPGVWYVSGRIRLERECCCDDLVIRRGGAPLEYASSLLRVAELHAERYAGTRETPELPAGHLVGNLALAATGSRPSQLRQRVLRLVSLHDDRAAAVAGVPGIREDLRLTRRSTVVVGTILLLALVAPLYFGASARTVHPEPRVVPRALAELEARLTADPAAANAKINDDDWTRLHDAVVYHDRPEVELLLKHGADPNAPTAKGWTPLHLAACFGRLDAADALLTAGARIDAPARYQRTPLHIAAGMDRPYALGDPQISNRDMVAMLLARGATREARDQYGLTPLLGAVVNKDAGVVRYLIAAGADRAAADKKGRTALHYACSVRDRACIAALLEARVNIDAADAAGMMPIDYLAVAPRVRLSEAKAAAKLLLAAGSRVDLYAAVGLGMADVAAERAKATPAAVNRRYPTSPASSTEWTPLHLAVSRDDAAMAALLLAAGADAGVADESGRAPVHIAATLASRPVVEVLLANRANPNARMLRGNTPLHVAAQVGRDELVGALVAGGADVNTTNDASDTPLHAALEVDAPSRAVVAALVQAGARPDVPNAAGRTSVDLAERAADPALRDLLRPAPAAAAE